MKKYIYNYKININWFGRTSKHTIKQNRVWLVKKKERYILLQSINITNINLKK